MNFTNNCFSEGLSEHRTPKYVLTLKRTSRHLPKHFDKLAEEEIREYIACLKNSNLSDRINMIICGTEEFY